MAEGILALVAAVVPGLLTWVWGRGLVRAMDDPTLPERVLGWRNRSAAAFAVGAAVLVVMLPRAVPWALPLLILGRLAGGFPARRALFGERWGFVAYLAHFARLALGVGGFWILLVVAPALVSWARPHGWWAAGALALVLVTWGLHYPRVLLRVTGARPLARPDLEERFEAVAAQSTAPMPSLWIVGHPDGRMANALALPHSEAPSVVFTRTLVEEFDPDELGAVFAHEQAHLEHYDGRRVKRLAALQTLAVLVGTVGAAAALEHTALPTAAVVVGWPVLVMVAVLTRLVRHRAHEAESDRRAVELCGDAGALARALVKLHTLALLPRRLSVEFESRATHPSLAHRLRAIEELQQKDEVVVASEGVAGSREVATAGPGDAPQVTVLQGANAGSWVLLGAQQAHWLEDVPEGTAREAEALRGAALRVRSLAYSEIVELRLEPRGTGHVLVASDRTGAAWSVPLAAGEAAPAQGALDGVDLQLAPPSAARPERKALGAMVACAGAIVALVTWSAAVVPALFGIVLPHPGPLAALGAAALAATAISLASGGAPGPVFDPGLVPLAQLGLAVCGAAAVWIARTTAWREHAGRTRTAPWVALVLGLLGLAFLALPALGFVTGGALGGHVAARDHPGGTILLAAAAGALLVISKSWARGAAAASVVLAMGAFLVGTRGFADLFVHDPFFAPGVRTSVAVTRVLDRVDEESLPATSGQLELSPSGDSWALHQFEVVDPDGPAIHRMIVGSRGGLRHEYSATSLILLDDATLLALFEEEAGPALELRPHHPGEPAHWRVDLPPLRSGAELAARPDTGRWRVSGTDPDTGAFVRVAGEKDGTFEVERWDTGSVGAVWVGGDGAAVIGVASLLDENDALLEASFDEDSPALWWLLAGSRSVGFGSQVLALDSAGVRELDESQLFVQCEASPPGGAEPLCQAHDGSRTAVWRVDPVGGERKLLVSLRGMAWAARPHRDDWLLLANVGTAQHLYRLGEEGLVRLDVGETPPWIQAVAGYEGGVGVLTVNRTGQPVLRRYALGVAPAR